MVIDTNILIAYLNNEAIVVELLDSWRVSGKSLIISSITTVEILSLNTLTPQKIKKVRLFLQTFLTCPLDTSLAETAAALRRKYCLKTPDAIVAATAQTFKLPLITRDHQFRKIKELTVTNP